MNSNKEIMDTNNMDKDVKFIIFYYCVSSILTFFHLIIIGQLFTKLSENKEFLTLKAIKFSLCQLLFFNVVGIFEAFNNINVVFRLINASFQLISYVLICILMMIAFNEVKKSQKYGEMYGEGVGVTSENYFLKVKVAFVIFGMLYCGIMVVMLAIVAKLFIVFQEFVKLPESSTSSFYEAVSMKVVDDINTSF